MQDTDKHNTDAHDSTIKQLQGLRCLFAHLLDLAHAWIISVFQVQLRLNYLSHTTNRSAVVPFPLFSFVVQQ